MRFDEFDLDYDILDALDSMHFEECTPIQEKSIGPILQGNDMIACAQTGTGKTAAYLLPIISLINSGGYPQDSVNCVVMVPTHELAQQIDRQMEGFSYFVPVTSLAIHGGNDGKEFARQQRGLKMGADIVIATPGRLLAHIKMGYVDLSKVSFFVLDEADRMLDMGFSDDILQIAKLLPSQRQTLLFSATMPQKIQQLAHTLLNNPVEVKIAVSKPSENIDQSAVVCYDAQKTAVLKHLFKTHHAKRVIVFASSKLSVKDLSRELKKSGWKTGEMHSDLEQADREKVMLDFKSSRIDILVATDIVARGIDIDDIAMVVNYDVPREAEDYVHRIGRTARAGSDGKAVTIIGNRDQRQFGLIEKFLEYKVRKEALPAELGEAPDYRPDARHSTFSPNSNRKNRSSKPRKKSTTPQPAHSASNQTNDTKPKKRRWHHKNKRNNEPKPQQ